MNDGEISKAYLEALPQRIKTRYAKKPKEQAAVHALADLWRIYTDCEVNDEIIDFINALVSERGALTHTGIAYAAINDLLAANLVSNFITPSIARNIRKALFLQDNLHGIVRGDLFNPSSGSVNNPVFAMIELGGLYPGIFHFLRASRLEMEKIKQRDSTNPMVWLEECFVPVGVVRAVLKDTYSGFVRSYGFQYSEYLRQGELSSFSLYTQRHAALIAQFSAWQACPVLLKFDGLLLRALSNTKATQKIPVDILSHLPYWAVAVETTGLVIDRCPVHYLMLSIESNKTKEGSEMPSEFLSLKIIPFSDSTAGWADSCVSFSFLNDSVAERMADQNAQSTSNEIIFGDLYRQSKMLSADREKELVDANKAILTAGVQIALYLASDTPDYDGRSPNRTERKGGDQKLTPQKGPHEFNVGVIVGSALKSQITEFGDMSERDSAGRIKMRPHWRAAHYHLYWTGEGRTVPRSRWIAPTPINLSAGDQLPVVSRRVDIVVEGQTAEPNAIVSAIDDSFFIEGPDHYAS